MFPRGATSSFNCISRGFFYNAENIIKAIDSGCTIVEVFTPLKKRSGGKSKIIKINSVFQVLRDFYLFVKQRRRKQPTKNVQQ